MHWQLGCSSPSVLVVDVSSVHPSESCPRSSLLDPIPATLFVLWRDYSLAHLIVNKSQFFLIGIFASCVKSAIVNLLLKNQNQGLQNTHTPTHTKQQQQNKNKKCKRKTKHLTQMCWKTLGSFFNLPTCPLCPSSGSKTIFATPSNQPIAINTVPRFWFFWI